MFTSFFMRITSAVSRIISAVMRIISVANSDTEAELRQNHVM
jgi:hypothetical protein